MKKIGLVGDSWLAMWDDASRSDKEAAGGLLSIMDRSRFDGVCLAKSGSTAKQWAADFEGRLTRALATECDAYVVSLLGNDAFAAINPQSDGGANVTLAELRTAFESLVKVLTALKATGRRVLVLQYTNPYPNDKIAALGCCLLNNAIYVATGMAGIGSVDLIFTSAVLDEPGAMSGIGIHPSPAGYARLAALIGDMLT